jgi:hypothetical protein
VLLVAEQVGPGLVAPGGTAQKGAGPVVGTHHAVSAFKQQRVIVGLAVGERAPQRRGDEILVAHQQRDALLRLLLAVERQLAHRRDAEQRRQVFAQRHT